MRDRPKLPLRLVNIESIPATLHGVYGFWCRTNGRCIYVGKAEKQPIKTRLRQEWANSHNPALKQWIAAFGEFLEVCYLPVKNRGKIDRMETMLIRAWSPEANIKKQKRR